jgi:hypothetical protein
MEQWNQNAKKKKLIIFQKIKIYSLGSFHCFYFSMCMMMECCKYVLWNNIQWYYLQWYKKQFWLLK